MRAPWIVTLVCGASGTGKSCLARPLAERYGAPLAEADDIVTALQAPPWKSGEQRVINVASGSARTAAEVAKIVRNTIPGAAIEIGDDLTPLEEQNVKMRASLDITSAKRLLNWSPKWPLEAGISEYAETFRRNISRSLNE